MPHKHKNETQAFTPARFFLITALVTLITGCLFGVLAALHYTIPHAQNILPDFSQLRPLHVSFILFWILIGASGCVLAAIEKHCSKRLASFQWLLWLIAIAGITRSYFEHRFGGREYWEFPPVYALPIALSWLLFLFNFIRSNISFRNWPVYRWMWLTGILFFLFTFIENYLWVFSSINQNVVKDLTIQWKANGSMVGSWNQLIYGLAIYLMEKISGDKQYARSRMAFTLYFLGLFNLLFNWGHHIYTLPTEPYVRYVSYAVSMTELIFLARMIGQWKRNIRDMQRWQNHMPYRYLAASEIWVFLNLLLALVMSVPGLNLYTHGTFITVAHAMGTTIGINSMILLAAMYQFLVIPCGVAVSVKFNRFLSVSTNVLLLIFWLSLIAAGIVRGLWQMSEQRKPFAQMMLDTQPIFIIFTIAGTLLMLSLVSTAVALIWSVIRCHITTTHQKEWGSVPHDIHSQQQPLAKRPAALITQK